MSRRRSSTGLTSHSCAKSSKNRLQSAGFTSRFLNKKLIILSSFVVILALIVYEYRIELINIAEKILISKNNDDKESFPKASTNSGGWRFADDKTKQQYDSDICNIDRKWAHQLNYSEFENIYRHKKPVIVRFRNGAKDWTDPHKWTVDSLIQEYGEWSVLSGNAREIVRRGGSGYVDSLFSEYINKLMTDSDSIGEPFYVFDRDFYNDSSLPSTLKPPSYFQIKDGVDDSIFFLGSSGSGVSFHKHADAWNGVIYGLKRWFLYMVDKTPPGGVYPGYTQREWYDKIYPKLPTKDKPLECIQRPGEILYLPEGTYHGTINIGDTIAIGIQKREAVTVVEKLFYDERKAVESMRNKDEKEKQKLLKKKQTIIEKLLQELPENAEVQMKAGGMYTEVGELLKAKKHTQKAIDMDPHFIIAVLNLAGIENKGTEIEPNTLPFWVQLRYAQLASGDSKGAEESQKKINQLQAKRT